MRTPIDASQRTSSSAPPALELWYVPFVPGSATSEAAAKEHDDNMGVQDGLGEQPDPVEESTPE